MNRMIVGKAWRGSPQTWEDTLFEKLKALLVVESEAVPESVWADISVNPEARQVWISCFTHFSVDFENNYEVWETFGDKLLSSSLYYIFIGNPEDPRLGKIISSSNPEERLTIINAAMTSKPFLRKMFPAKFGGLHDYIRCTEEFSGKTDIMEDVFEAFISAIMLSVDKVAWGGKFMGPGYVSVNKFVHWFYLKKLSQQEFDISGSKDVKTFMKEFFEKFYLYTTMETRVNTRAMEGMRVYEFLFRVSRRDPVLTINPFEGMTTILNAAGDLELSFATDYATGIATVSAVLPAKTTKADVEPMVFETLRRHFRLTPPHSEKMKIYERYIEEGEKPYELLANFFPVKDYYDQLQKIVEKDGFRGSTIDVKRSDFSNGSTSLIIWAKERATGEKKAVFRTLLSPPPGTTKQTGENISSFLRTWVENEYRKKFESR